MRSSLLLAFLFLLSGCAAPGVERSGATVTIDQRIVAGEGHVLLKVQSARPSTLFNPKWQMLRLARSGTGAAAQPFELNDISSPQAAGSLFFARVPAGTYRIAEVQSVGPGPGLIFALMAGDLQDLTARNLEFTVRAGELSNLGTIVDSPPTDKDPATRRVVLLRSPLGQAGAAEAVQDRTGQALTLPQAGGWLGQESPQESERALRRARALISVLSPGEDALGSVVLGGTALGQVLIRNTAGEWHSEPLDTLAAVTYARRLGDGTLLAGIEDGRIFSRAPGAPWRAMRLPTAAGAIRHIEPLASGGWLVTAQAGNEIAAWKLEAGAGSATRIAAIDTGGALYAGTLATADTLVLTRNTPAFARESRMTVIDKRSLQTSAREEKFLVFSYQRLRGGEIVMDRYSGLSHYVSISTDDGRSWQHGQTEAPLWPYFVDAKRGYALDFNRGMFSVDSFVVRTLDGGRSWTRIGTPISVEIAGRVLGVGDNSEIVASLAWEVRSSRDEGRTWRRELPRLLD